MKTKTLCGIGVLLVFLLAAASLFVGKYPLSLRELMAGNELQWRVFRTLRLSRTLAGVIGGFALGVAGFVYQTVFRNPLASPDIIGVSSGASAGAAAGILFFSRAGAGAAGTLFFSGASAGAAGTLFFSGTFAVTASSFAGALLAVGIVLGLSALDRNGRKSTIVLSGIAVHSLAQTALMCLKLTADPERQLASIEYWIMGSLNGISSYSMVGNFILCLLCLGVLFPLHRQILLLSGEEGEIRMLGVSVGKLRLFVLLAATLTVSSVVSLTGLISFIGLLAPHGARLLTRDNRPGTMLLGGLLGSVILTGADILARSVAASELPVSIFTSLLGAPFLILLVRRSTKNCE